ncbi:FAD-dependent oxidoreductase [Microbacterium azadirachtae]|uniref:FAD-dependent oxidoreductase n=1 Tax=Microbacterium azadirachtae TaxID=582680 RepID=UPI00088CEB4A|nr:FAD-dependent oxidoreductase [Microbacterium azadirachtae]SDL74292.1 ferredoxin--NADP+ reductase [Microbacterium azadirachtae]SEG03504.1 ferredoxin--NADP+ reductase [Microbacterium azadirachtae]SEG06326.1 ferredoxin--NADP+ reductase [Microbacterium azadirachtae]
MTAPAPSAPLRVAIVGAGPAGIYAGNILANALAARGDGSSVEIDLFESLPAPYGLIRYGVAPDHPRIKGIVNSLHEMLDARAEGADRRVIRFLGNVEVGRDVSIDELQARYHAVILATGAIRDAALRIPGVDLLGSHGAADFVSWFDGHPDVPRTWPLVDEQVAVIGNGNVALDVARILAKLPENLRSTEVPDNVLEGLEASAVTDVHVFGRRGPADIKFTPIELRELGEVAGVDILLDDADFDGVDPASASTNQLKIMLRTLNSWRDRPENRGEPTGNPRRLHLHFWHAPVEITGSDRVEGIRFERTAPNADGSVSGTGVFRDYPVTAVYRAVGYFGSPVVEVPFDERRGVVPNEGGRVDGAAGVYATGWIKRGPVGLIGHTKSDATETIANLLEDVDAGRLVAPVETADILELLAEREVEVTTWDGWLELDAHERALGAAHRHVRERVKVVPREEQVEISRSAALSDAGARIR